MKRFVDILAHVLVASLGLTMFWAFLFEPYFTADHKAGDPAFTNGWQRLWLVSIGLSAIYVLVESYRRANPKVKQ